MGKLIKQAQEKETFHFLLERLSSKILPRAILLRSRSLAVNRG
ncbi:hypothetical protein CCACVL1_02263 [Corchorus capsularis]|uniref:Uncharacterized protein n=1 Tax=Corchorus capsularis TaxID=210143 RepID=A0A1R3K9M9_COCAP|nr:hypothetical protein CCACVL1_02263 [Corchorus capsularis]